MKLNKYILIGTALTSISFMTTANASCPWVDNPGTRDLIAGHMEGNSRVLGPLDNKKFTIEHVTAVDTNNSTTEACAGFMRIHAKVSLERKLRRDAKGTATFIGKLQIVPRKGICLVDTTMTELELSNTTRVGEYTYKKIFGTRDLCPES